MSAQKRNMKRPLQPLVILYLKILTKQCLIHLPVY